MQAVAPIVAAMPDISLIEQSSNAPNAFYLANVFFSILGRMETICSHVENNSLTILPQGCVNSTTFCHNITVVSIPPGHLLHTLMV
jgi:hypothetical protein